MQAFLCVSQYIQNYEYTLRQHEWTRYGMSEYRKQARILQAMSHPVRLQILESLARITMIGKVK